MIQEVVFDFDQIMKTVKDRVFYLYSRYPFCVESDRLLIDVFEWKFHSVTPHESITRFGRWWRSEKAGEKRFFRRRKKTDMQEVYRNYFGEG